MNVTKYSSFTDIMKNIFTNPKKITYVFFFPSRKKKTHLSIKKDNKGSCVSSSRKDWLIVIQDRRVGSACFLYESSHSSI